MYHPHLQGTRESFTSTLKTGLHNPMKCCNLSTTLHLIPRDSDVGVLIICVLIFSVFCIVCTVFFVLFHLCIFITCFVCTSVRTTATK